MTPDLHTRIVATLGSRDPSDPDLPQNAPDLVERLAAAGLGCVRINLSHNRAWSDGGGYAVEEALLDRVAAVNEGRSAAGDDRRVAVLADLQGVKLRLHLPDERRRDGWFLEPGAEVVLGLARDAEAPTVDGTAALRGDLERALAEAGDDGVPVHFGDGETLLRGTALDDDGRLRAVVEVGGIVHDRRGVTFRGVDLTLDSVLTPKDRHDLVHFVLPAALEGRLAWVALSFVRRPEDIGALRRFVRGVLAAVGEGTAAPDDELAQDAARRLEEAPAIADRLRAAIAALPPDPVRSALLAPPIVAKIETREAAAHAAAIVRDADAVMVARGDLGLQCEPHQVPRLQKEILRDALRAGRPGIVATQMLGSLETGWEPRRPEASDVFNAVLDRADALMLSGETAIGRHPVRAVEVLAGIAAAAEGWVAPGLSERDRDHAAFYETVRAERAWRGESAAVTDHACYLAARTAPVLGCRAIVALTASGGTARMAARFRPAVPVMAAVPHAAVADRLALSHGVIPVVVPFRPGGSSVDDAIEAALVVMRERGLLQAEDRVVVLCGRPLGGRTGTNLLSMEHVPGGA